MFSESQLIQKTKALISNSKSPQLIVAVSGGLDSMTLLFVLHKYFPGQIIAAHCNFNLRDEESMEDFQFVESYCLHQNIPFETISFNTKDICKQEKKGTQETARILRYNWFGDLSKKYAESYIVTAHHADDNAETILLNIARGTGINGLKGIQETNQNIIRPLLSFSKKEIAKYALENDINFREDSSNKSDDYKRNQLRHHIIPALEKINIEFVNHINELGEFSNAAQRIINKEIELFKSQSCHIKNNIFYISKNDLLKTIEPLLYLHHLLFPFGFNTTQTKLIFASMQQSYSKTFYANTFQLRVDKLHLCIGNFTVNEIHYNYSKDDFIISNNHYNFLVKTVQKSESSNLTFNSDHLYVDITHVSTNQLYFRCKKEGDKFMPLGMTNYKKLSDYFIDKKCPKIDSENAIVLTDGENILAVIPFQVDNRFRINEDTKTYLQIIPN